MRLPKKVRIAHRDYALKRMSPKESERLGVSGSLYCEKGEIHALTQGVAPSEAANTIVHEVLHGCWQAAGLPAKCAEERAVNGLANVLCAVIRDNPALIRAIQKAVKA